MSVRDRGGQAPALRQKSLSSSVGRGPVPRHAAVYRKIAGDRPPRYVREARSSVGRGPVPRHV